MRLTAVFGASALAFAGLALVAPTAQAVHELNLIELDGNAVTDNPAYDDWDSVCKKITIDNDPVTDPVNAPEGLIPDECGSAGPLLTSNTANAWAADGAHNATIFTGGGSKDPLTVAGWKWKDQLGGLPDKDNLEHAFAARYSILNNVSDPVCGTNDTATNCDVLFFGSDRFDNSGDAQQGFWFFRQKIGLDSATGTFTGRHSDGDLLILSDFSNGGSVSTINIYKWVGADATGGLQFVTGGDASKCGATVNDTFCGIVNPAEDPLTKAPWSFTDKSGNHNYLNGEFFEAGVNLSHPDINLGNECFSSIVAETRSSTSTTATLKDFVLAQFAQCSATLSTTPSADTGTNSVLPGVPVTDTAIVQGSGSSNPPTPTGDVTFYLCGPLATGLCTAGTQVGDPVALTSSAPPPGEASATSAQVNTPGSPLAPGRYCFRATWPGDSNYIGALSHNGTGDSECFVVKQIPTLIATTQRAYPNDSATITSSQSGDSITSGTVTFRLYDTLANCQAHGVTADQGGLLYTKAVTLSSTNTASTDNSTVAVNTNTTVYWWVTYTPAAGDTAHEGRQSDCLENTQFVFTNNTGPGTLFPPATP